MQKLAAALLTMFSLNAFGEVYVGERSIIIYGEISDRDFALLSERQEELAYKEVSLLGPGGDVSAAIQIGRLIRQYEGTTVVGVGLATSSEKESENLPAVVQGLVATRNRMQDQSIDDQIASMKTLRSQSTCYSSCALIWISGVNRQTYWGKLGIHRPYLATESEDAEEVRNRYKMMESTVEQYIADMGVDHRFYQLMMNTQPEDIRVFEDDEVYMLVPQHDSLMEEVYINSYAKLYGISIIEYRRRSAQANSCQIQQMAVLDCRSAARWGVSEDVFRSGKEKYDECVRIRQRAEETLSKMKLSDRLASREEQSMYECQRSVLSDAAL